MNILSIENANSILLWNAKTFFNISFKKMTKTVIFCEDKTAYCTGNSTLPKIQHLVVTKCINYIKNMEVNKT